MSHERTLSPSFSVRTKSRTERTLYRLPDKAVSVCRTRLKLSHSANNPPPPPEDEYFRGRGDGDKSEGFNFVNSPYAKIGLGIACSAIAYELGRNTTVFDPRQPLVSLIAMAGAVCIIAGVVELHQDLD